MKRGTDSLEITVEVLLEDEMGDNNWDLKTIRLPSYTLKQLAEILQDYQQED